WGVSVDGAETVDAASANIHGAQRALRGDLALHSGAVLQGVGNTQVRVERHHADRNLRHESGIDGIRRERRVGNETQQIDAVEMQEGANRGWAGSIIEQAGTPADHSPAGGAGRIGEADPRSEVVRLMVEEILP